MKGLIQISGKKLTSTLRDSLFASCKMISSSCEVLQSSQKSLHISFEDLPDTKILKNALQSSTTLKINIHKHLFKNIIFVTLD